MNESLLAARAHVLVVAATARELAASGGWTSATSCWPA